MEYQQLPPVSMIIGSPPNTAHHVMNGNSNTNGNNHQLLTMQPPLLPLQVAHNLHQLTTHNSQSNGSGGVHHGSNNQNQSSQPLPPTAQLLQAIHNNTQNNAQNMDSNNNNSGVPNNNTNGDENNRWTQYQVQQLWQRHHAYLNGKVSLKNQKTLKFFTENLTAELTKKYASAKKFPTDPHNAIPKIYERRRKEKNWFLSGES